MALKAIHPQYARDADIVSRFMNEAKSVNQIGHDHIVDITDFGHTPGGDFTSSWSIWTAGRSPMRSRRSSDLARALNIAAQIKPTP